MSSGLSKEIFFLKCKTSHNPFHLLLQCHLLPFPHWHHMFQNKLFCQAFHALLQVWVIAHIILTVCNCWFLLFHLVNYTQQSESGLDITSCRKFSLTLEIMCASLVSNSSLCLFLSTHLVSLIIKIILTKKFKIIKQNL